MGESHGNMSRSHLTPFYRIYRKENDFMTIEMLYKFTFKSD